MAIRILIADDHAVVRQAIAYMLADHPDLEIVGEAKDGQDAIEQIHAARPDVVLMDVSMPRLNGIEATQWIATAFPVAFVTKSAAAEELVAAIRSAC